jgi:hypothetical protein
MSIMRKPKTQAERKANQDGCARPSRSPKNLPNAWDDNVIASRSDRNWKKFRKTKWKN